MIEKQTYTGRGSWLVGRTRGIGGSDAAAVLGLNPYMSNTELWAIKTGRVKKADLSGNKLVEYGTRAEYHLRGIFELDFPEYRVEYEPFSIYTNSDYPWACASLDGRIFEDSTGRTGILEIKTATISGSAQAAKWKDRIPDNYFCQILHYMAVMEADFSILKAQLKYERPGDLLDVTKHFYIEWEDVKEQAEYLMEQEKIFWQYVTADKEPPLVLPEI